LSQLTTNLSSSAPAPPTAAPAGHPPGLYICFGTELWERFCFYGMRALLVLYFIKKTGPFHIQQEMASTVYGAYLAMIYATNVFGGLIADKLLGFRRAVLLGGLLMSGGEFLLLAPSQTTFYAGLSLLITGCGLLKPNISAILGKLYPKGDARRDSGFTIFYMGINLGAFLGPIITGLFAEETYGFAAAGVGMILAVVYFAIGKKKYGEHGLPPAGVPGGRAFGITAAYVVAMVPIAFFMLQHEDWVRSSLNVLGVAMALFFIGLGVREGRVQLGRMIALIFLLLANAVFWACFEQAGNSLNLFADKNIEKHVFGGEMPTVWAQSFNAIFIVALGIPFSMLWIWLEKRRINPPAPVKFSLGLMQVGLGFYVLVLGQSFASDGLVPLVFLVLCYLIHTTGELCLSPVGLSTMTKLAPERFSGLVMGSWFLSTAYGSFLSGQISKIAGRSGNVSTQDMTAVQALPVYTDVFWLLTKIGVLIGLGALVLSPLISRLMRGIK
jgi:POT family proton-dependent oligopeptide transporter